MLGVGRCACLLLVVCWLLFDVAIVLVLWSLLVGFDVLFVVCCSRCVCSLFVVDGLLLWLVVVVGWLPLL